MIDRNRILNGRKGLFGIKEGAELLLAIVAIGLIAFFAVKLYSWATSDNESEAAKALLDSVIGKVEALDEGTRGNFALKSQKDWHLVAFEKSSFMDDRPEKCAFSSCLCICPEASRDSCQTDGFCRKLSYDTLGIGFRDGSNFLILDNQNSLIVTGASFSSIAFPKSNLFELATFKNPSKEEISEGLGVWYPAPSLLSTLIPVGLNSNGLVESVTVFDGLFEKTSDFARHDGAVFRSGFKIGDSAFEKGVRELLTAENNCIYVGWILKSEADKFDISPRRVAELKSAGVDENTAAYLHGQYGSYKGPIADYRRLGIFTMNPNGDEGTRTDNLYSSSRTPEFRADLILKRFDLGEVERYELKVNGEAAYIDYFQGECLGAW